MNSDEQSALAARIAERLRQLRADRPPPRGEAAEAFGRIFTPEKFAELLAEMPEANRERIFRQFPHIRPKP